MVDFKKIGADGEVRASKIKKVRSQIVKEDAVVEPLSPIQLEVCGNNGFVTYGKREVVNTGNFETVTIEISATLPIGAEVSKKDMDAALKRVRAFVLSNLDEDVDEIRTNMDRGSC